MDTGVASTSVHTSVAFHYTLTECHNGPDSVLSMGDSVAVSVPDRVAAFKKRSTKKHIS